MAEQVLNRYRNKSPRTETFFLEDGRTVRMIPGGTVVAPAGSTVAKHRLTVIIERNVKVDNYEDVEDLEDQEELETPEVEVPQHENDNLTNTRPGDGATILTDEFDGSGGVGAVNTSAARPFGYVEPETPKPEADTSPKFTEEEAKKPGVKSTRGK